MLKVVDPLDRIKLLLTIHILKLFPGNNMKDVKIMHKTTSR